jgi:hypothetical protein
MGQPPRSLARVRERRLSGEPWREESRRQTDPPAAGEMGHRLAARVQRPINRLNGDARRSRLDASAAQIKAPDRGAVQKDRSPDRTRDWGRRRSRPKGLGSFSIWLLKRQSPRTSRDSGRFDPGGPTYRRPETSNSLNRMELKTPAWRLVLQRPPAALRVRRSHP